MRIYIFFKIAVLLAANSASATIIYVPDDCPTIQQGIDASYNGDTVLVKPGEYVENINFNGKNIVVGSRFMITGDTTYIHNTIIDGDSAGSVVTFESGEDSTAVIIGFTIRHGYSYYGAGIYCINAGPVIRHNKITQNHAHHQYYSSGGGIYCSNSTSLIYGNLINDNRACFGAGIYCDSSVAKLSYNTIIYNTADW